MNLPGERSFVRVCCRMTILFPDFSHFVIMIFYSMHEPVKLNENFMS
jgi:hypothetical protein